MKKTFRSFSMLWAGLEESFETYCAAVMNAGAGYTSDPNLQGTHEKDSLPDLLHIDGKLGIITVHGILTNEDAWWNSYAGLVSYNSIREAVYYAAASPDIEEILIDTFSPGGVVFGVMDTAQAVANAAAIKPVTMFSDSLVASGAYWALAAPANERYISPVAQAGSIGVLNIHREFSKAAEEAGYTFTVFRSGKYKALGTPEEPLSTLAKKEIQDRVDYMSGVFEQDVAEYTGVSKDIVASKMGQGRVFIGQQAVDVGLVDGISNFDDVVAAIHARIHLKETGGNNMKKKKLSLAAFQALAASGADTSQVELDPAAVATAEPAAVATAEPAVIDPPAATTVTDPPAATETISPPAESEVVKLLKEQLVAKDEALFEAKAELKELKVNVASYDGLRKIAAIAINNMSVALGGTVDASLEAMDAKILLTQHQVVQERFVKEFKVGGVSSAQAETDAPSPAEVKPTRRAVAESKIVQIK